VRSKKLKIVKMKVNFTYFVIKTLVLIAILLALRPLYAIPLCLFVTWAYQYVIAFIYGVHAMPSMDTVCFFGNDEARVNFMSVTVTERFSFESA
jgi:hypothetical protein